MDTRTGDPSPHPLSLRVCTCGTTYDAMGNDNVTFFQIIRLHHTNAEFYIFWGLWLNGYEMKFLLQAALSRTGLGKPFGRSIPVQGTPVVYLES